MRLEWIKQGRIRMILKVSQKAEDKWAGPDLDGWKMKKMM